MRERPNLFFRMRRAWFQMRLRLAGSRYGRGRFRASRFVWVPPHHHFADPGFAHHMMAGQIVLAGRMLMTHGRHPFTMEGPSRGFNEALAGFQWLVHFDASDRRAVQDYARILVRAFMQRREADRRAHVEDPSTIARRVISWISFSLVLTRDVDAAFYRQLLDHLARDAALLALHAQRKDNGMARLEAAIALMLQALCLDLPDRALHRAEQRLAASLAATIAEDGLPRDRNGATAIRIVADLEPLVAVYRLAQKPAPAFIGQAIAALLQATRVLRHPDGALVTIGGAAQIAHDFLGRMLSLAKGTQPTAASLPDSGFERLEDALGVVIADAGGKAPPHFARLTGASALAFEFSTRVDRIIVNCGLPVAAEGDLAVAWRGGAAHSTLLLEEEGCGEFVSRPTLLGRRVDLLVRRDEAVAPVRRLDEAGKTIRLGHNGFRRKHGYVVERQLTLLPDGAGLRGLDRFIDADTKGKTVLARIAFHLHPSVHVLRLSAGNAMVLRLPNETPGRDVWVFEAPGHPLELEESRFHEGDGPGIPTQQIVIELALEGTTDLVWRLQPYRPEFE